MNTDNNVSDELLLHFFLTFSKFEFALKTAGFAVGNEKQVSPNWDKYAQSIKTTFNKGGSAELLMAIKYFLKHPPWKQILIDDAMSWDESVPNNGLTETEQVLLLIRRVRNNLFHGGKFDFDELKNTKRKIKLLSYSIVILKACLELSPDVKYNYDNAAI